MNKALSRMQTRLFIVLAVLCFACGAWLGFELSRFNHFSEAKLLGLIGQVYAMLGVIVLAEIVTTNKGWRAFSLNWIAPSILWAHSIIPLGVAVAGAAAWLISRIQYPSAWNLGRVALGFFIYSLPQLFLLDSFIVNPVFTEFRDREVRWRFFGAYLVLVGCILQFASGVLDFIADAKY